MAARKNRQLTPRHRDAIKTSQLVNRLQDFVLLNEEDLADNQKWRARMSQSEVTAATSLLKKTLPDLTAATISGDDDASPIQIIKHVIVDPRNPDS